MTKSKRFVSRMMFALLVLTLVSFCFVGFTFARYTSSGTQAATASVAKWSITDGSTEGSTPVSIDKLSPSMAEYTEGATRTNDIIAKVLTIKNEGDVSAKLTLNALHIELPEGTTLPTGEGTLTAEQVLAHFSVIVCKADGSEFVDTDLTLAPNGTLDVYAKVTWTSDISDTIKGDAADAEDTFIGQNVTTIEFDISYVAVQASELPEETPAA